MGEVTEAMIEAGAEAHARWLLDDDAAQLVVSIYTAMRNAAPVGEELVERVARAINDELNRQGQQRGELILASPIDLANAVVATIK